MGFEESVSSAVQGAVRTATLLGENDLAFHTSLDKDFNSSLQATRAQLLALTTSLLDYVSPRPFEPLDEVEAVETRWGDLIDIVDHLLEQTDGALEELDQKKAKDAAEQEKLVAKQAQLPPLPANLRNAQDLTPPQRKFVRKPDNSDAPWRPLIQDKLHAQVPLLTEDERTAAQQAERSTHPYAHEIEQITYPAHMFQKREPVMYKDISTQPLGWVSTQQTLDAMLADLRQATEIAVDLEHHDFHSFRGFVCLMQISTRDKDWIVDTLSLREELSVLNEVFADARIVKILHGAAMDIIWLQRDFGLYIVNLFDSFHATKVLGFDGHGLAFLLKKYVDFDADKRYQLADWRIRPLPKEMLFYARCDTHFLLYVYDCLRNELLDRSTPGTHNMLASVLQASAAVSLREYTKEPYDAAEGQGTDGWQVVLFKNYATRAFGPQQLETLKALHQWRDQVARELDESTRFVMSNNALVSLAAATPRDKKALQGCCKQLSSTMQGRLEEVLAVIASAVRYADEALANAPAAAITTSSAFFEDEQARPVQVATLKTSVVPVAAVADLVADASRFWGTAGVQRPRPGHLSETVLSLELSVAMPALDGQVFITAEEEAAEEAARVAAEAAMPAPVKAEVAKPFVVREMGKPKKRTSEVIRIDDSDAEEEEGRVVKKAKSATEAEEEDAAAQAKKARKREKKEAKLRKKQAEAAATTQSQHEEDEEAEATKAPFDYIRAEPILAEPKLQKQKQRKFGDYQPTKKIVRPKQQQGTKQTTFKR